MTHSLERSELQTILPDKPAFMRDDTDILPIG